MTVRAVYTEVSTRTANVPGAGRATGERGQQGNVFPPGMDSAGTIRPQQEDRLPLLALVDRLNRLADTAATQVRFRWHEGSKRPMVQVVDRLTGKVLKEVPPHQILDVLARIRVSVGLLLEKEV